MELAKAMDKVENVGILEVNISCPNVDHGGMAFGTDSNNVEKLTYMLKESTKKPVYMKLSPNVTDISEIAKSAQRGGADGIALINTLLGMRIDVKNRKPVIANKKGGYSGPGIFPVALRMVYEVFETVDLPIIGMGGVSSSSDVLEMIMAGATAVEIGGANLVNPMICKEIIDELPKEMERLEIKSQCTRDRVRVDLHTARPGIVIGRRGAEAERLRASLEKLTSKQVQLTTDRKSVV